MIHLVGEMFDLAMTTHVKLSMFINIGDVLLKFIYSFVLVEMDVVNMPSPKRFFVVFSHSMSKIVLQSYHFSSPTMFAFPLPHTIFYFVRLETKKDLPTRRHTK